MEPINPSVIFNSIELSDNICPICRDLLNENEHKLACNHSFHSGCIIEWFRNSPSCPMCRCQPDTYICKNTKNARLRFNSNFARRKDAPKQLKNMLEKLKRLKNKKRENSKEYAQWCKSSDGIKFKELRKINTSFLKKRPDNSIRKLEIKIREYPILYIPVLRKR